MRYNQQVKEVEYCDDNSWVTQLLLTPGSSSLLPATSCREIALCYKSSAKNGKHWIKPSYNDLPYQVTYIFLNKNIVSVIYNEICL